MSTKDDRKSEDRRFADKITFGLTQWGGCAIMDFIGDPVIGKHVQDRLAPQFIGHEVHAKKAEVIGDGAAFAIFLAVEKFCPGIITAMKNGAKPLLDPIYERIGNNRLQEWAKRHHVDPQSDDFRKKLDEWKDFQAENFAMASFIATSSVITNVATQKQYGNPRSLAVIGAGKLIGATVTLGATMGLRSLAPRTMHRFEERVSKHLVLPGIKATHKLFGVEGAAVSPQEEATGRKWADEAPPRPVTEAPREIASPAKAPSYQKRVTSDKEASFAQR